MYANPIRYILRFEISIILLGIMNIEMQPDTPATQNVFRKLGTTEFPKVLTRSCAARSLPDRRHLDTDPRRSA